MSVPRHNINHRYRPEFEIGSKDWNYVLVCKFPTILNFKIEYEKGKLKIIFVTNIWMYTNREQILQVTNTTIQTLNYDREACLHEPRFFVSFIRNIKWSHVL